MSNFRNTHRAVLASLALTLGLPLGIGLSAPATAGWTLDPARSHVSYVTIKAKDIGEVNVFQELSGSIGDDGQAAVTMALDSVETLVPIRNERMREILFQTTNYADATLTAKVDPEIIANMEPGQVEQIAAEGMLSLHGQQQPMVVQVQAAKLDDGTVMVASTKPLIVDAEKFGLSDGVEKLRELAGLESISHAVPVTFVLTFAAGE